MLKLINLADNSEKEISTSDLQNLNLANMWIDAISPTEEEIKALEGKCGVPTSYLKPMEIGSFSGVYFVDEKIVLYFETFKGLFEPNNIIPIALIFTKDFILTVRNEVTTAIASAKRRMHKDKVDTPIYMVYTILDEIITEYYVYLEKVEDMTSGLEESILENPQESTLKEMFRLKTKLISFNKLLWCERGAVSSIKRAELGFITFKQKALFESLLDDLTRQVNIVETFREIISDGLDAYLSTLSNRINFSIKSLTVVMLYLTIITTITSFPNTIATIFGIPTFGANADWRIIVVLLAVSTFLPMVWLFKKRWIKLE